MNQLAPSTHKTTLNAKQLKLLITIYAFRFVTIELTAHYKGLTTNAVYKSFSILLDQGYIARHFDSSYKLRGKPATYFLAPKAFKVLKNEQQLNQGILRSRYNDKNVKEAFITRYLLVFKLCLQLKERFGDSFDFYTQSDMADHDFFLRPLSYAYVTFDQSKQAIAHSIIEIIDSSMPPFVIRKRLLQYIEHYQSGAWDETNTDYPTLLLVCDTVALINKIQRQATKLLNQAYLNEDELFIKVIVAEELVWSV